VSLRDGVEHREPLADRYPGPIPQALGRSGQGALPPEVGRLGVDRVAQVVLQ
jgi:hypothetical protein